MAATEEIEKEILAEMAANPVPYAAGQVNDVITIDGETRMISVPASEIFFGVESDKDVERKHFRCPKVVGDGIDLSKHQIYISYITSDSAGKTFSGNAGLYLCEDVATDGDDITFSWQLSGNVFASAGFIAFKVLAAKTDGENVQTRWNTVPAIGTVLMTVPDGMDIGEAYPDIVTQLLERMASVEKIATEEAMQGYVNTYLEAHPGEIDETLTDPKKAAPASVVGELKEEIDDIAVKEYAEMQVEFIEGSYIPYFNQHTITENSNAKYLKISCKSGEKYKIHTKNFYDGRAYALYSGENEYATDYYPGTKLTEVTEEIVIPEDVTTLVVNSELSFPAKVEKYVINNKNYYAEKKIMESEIMRNKHEREYFYSSCINLINSENLLPDKGVIFQVGKKYEIIDSPGYYALKSLIPVQEGETYTLLTKYARAVIYDFNLTVIDSKYEGADPVVFTIPTGGAFLSCFYQNSKPISGLYKGNRIGIDFISPNIFLGKTTSINGLNWCAFGDSLTDKNTLKDEESGTRNYVDFIQWSTGLNVTNLGKGGTGYMADNGYQQSFIDRISQIPTDSNIITCFGSFNDASKAKEHIGTIDDDTKDTLYGCLNLFVTGVQNHCPDSIIGLITPTPWSVYNNVNGDSEFSEQYVDAIINIAKKYGLPLLDLYHSSGLRPWDSAFKEKYFRDDTGDGTAEGVHPLQETHRKYIAPQVENFIRSIANTYISISY